jgi:hypothetical protein
MQLTEVISETFLLEQSLRPITAYQTMPHLGMLSFMFVQMSVCTVTADLHMNNESDEFPTKMLDEIKDLKKNNN